MLTNTPIWMDTRAADICDELNEKIGADEIFKLSGNSLQPSYTTAKIIWYQRNLPEVYARTCKILQSNSYIAYKLTGEMSQDLSQGYGLHCFDMHTGTWDMKMCERLGIPAEFLPEIHPCHCLLYTSMLNCGDILAHRLLIPSKQEWCIHRWSRSEVLAAEMN